MKVTGASYHSRSNIFVLFIFTCLFNLLFGELYAQTDTASIDSLDAHLFLDASNAHTEFFTASDFENFHIPDTSLDLFQKYNPARRQTYEYTWLGNLGAVYTPRFFEFNRYMGFDYGRHEHDLYLKDISELNYYRTNIPFTDLYYVIGSNSEQYFSVRHTRNVGRDFNFALGLDKISSEGYFQHMKQNVLNVDATLWYKTKNEFYRVYAGGIHSENKNDENGGINNDTLFELPFANLAAPFRTYGFTAWSNWQGEVTQQLIFGKRHIVNDSTGASIKIPLVYLRHTFGAHNYNYKFEDLFDTAFYSFLYVDDDTLRDVSDVDGFYNKLSVGNTSEKNDENDSLIHSPFRWEVFALQQYHEVSDQSGEMIFRNFIAGTTLKGSEMADSLFNFNIDAAFDFVPGDYEAKASARLTKYFIQPELGVQTGKYSPTQLQQHYYGFRFRWETNFSPVNYSSGFVNVHLPEIHLEADASFTRMENFIYFENYLPAQFPSALTVFQLQLKKDFILGDFHLNNALAYQSISAIIDKPVYLANVSWYFQKHLFHSALFTQIGFDGWYISDYRGQYYNMITGQFNENNISEPLNYEPVIDVFASFDIRTFRFFIKGDNIAQGLFSKGLYEAPRYPMQPRGIKLGVNWMLFY